MFLVGEYIDADGFDTWGFVGIFDDVQKAIAACKDKRNRFYCPVTINEVSPDELTDLPGVVYPNV